LGFTFGDFFTNTSGHPVRKLPLPPSWLSRKRLAVIYWPLFLFSSFKPRMPRPESNLILSYPFKNVSEAPGADVVT
jgi:hypothetical protein